MSFLYPRHVHRIPANIFCKRTSTWPQTILMVEYLFPSFLVDDKLICSSSSPKWPTISPLTRPSIRPQHFTRGSVGLCRILYSLPQIPLPGSFQGRTAWFFISLQLLNSPNLKEGERNQQKTEHRPKLKFFLINFHVALDSQVPSCRVASCIAGFVNLNEHRQPSGSARGNSAVNCSKQFERKLSSSYVVRKCIFHGTYRETCLINAIKYVTRISWNTAALRSRSFSPATQRQSSVW